MAGLDPVEAVASHDPAGVADDICIDNCRTNSPDRRLAAVLQHGVAVLNDELAVARRAQGRPLLQRRWQSAACSTPRPVEPSNQFHGRQA